jgi:RNA polymerase sigma-70 factor, ECF subfamily
MQQAEGEQLGAPAGVALSPPDRAAPVVPGLAAPLFWEIGAKKEGRIRSPAATVQQASKRSPPAGSVRAPVAQESPEPGDTELVRDAAGGDSDAFHALIDRHAGHLFRLAVSLCGSAADADDVLQETFAGAFRSLRRFEGRSSVKTWLSRILVTQAALWRRGKGARRAMSLSEGTAGQEPAAPARGTGPDRVAWRMDLQAALDKLSHDHREVIVLRELQGLSYDEIAQALGIPRGTVESRLFRARAELREHLRSYLP